MKQVRSLGLLVLTLLGFVGSSSAQIGGYYVGIGAGATDWNADLGSFDDGTLTDGVTDAKDDGWKLLVGYRFSKYFGVEGGYADLGKVTFRGNSSGCPDPDDCSYAAGPVALERQADGFYGQAVASWPFGAFDVYGKVGFFAVDLELVQQDALATFHDSLGSTETIWGAGLQYRFDRPVVRVEWERITEAPNDSIDFLTANLLYRFGRR